MYGMVPYQKCLKSYSNLNEGGRFDGKPGKVSILLLLLSIVRSNNLRMELQQAELAIVMYKWGQLLSGTIPGLHIRSLFYIMFLSVPENGSLFDCTFFLVKHDGKVLICSQCDEAFLD